ncbi:hypothetical protein BJV78DRAFT_312934 [Lactifluus subvellereus]|nr:hypothetical protein BJV78DRAFT_312934 [Lactifluus subvellereus]
MEFKLTHLIRGRPVRSGPALFLRIPLCCVVVMSRSRSVEPQPDLAYTYTLVHAFLKERSHKKAASALKRAATGIVTIDDSAQHEGSTLLKILREWRELKAAADARDSTSSDSDSDDFSSDEDREVEDNLTVPSTGMQKPCKILAC